MFRRFAAFGAGAWNLLAPKSLTNRVFALYGVTLFVFFAAGLGLFLNRQYEEQVMERQESSIMLIEVAAQAIQDSAVIGDYDTVQKTLQKTVQGSFFGSGTFIDLTGARLDARGNAVPNAEPPPWFERWVASQFYDINRTISVGGRDYGVLRLGFDTRYVAGDMWGVTQVASLAALISFLLGLIPIHVLLKRWLGNLDRLKLYEQAMANGTLDVARVQTRGAPEEIQRVVDMFKRTAELVREREVSRRALDNQKFALDQHAIVSITDLAGRITYANDRFCEISGYRREELLGQSHRLVKSGLHPASYYEDMWRTISEGRVWRGEICNRSRGEGLYWLSATIVPLLGSDGQPEQYIAIRTDITDRKAIESRLESAKEVAVQASVAKTQFLANVSHEIRTPLNAVLGMLKLLQSTALNMRQADYVAKSEAAARSLLLLLNDVLDFSKAEANKIELDPRPFRLDALMGDLAVVLGANLGTKPVELVLDVDASVPQDLLGDDLRLQQVLINLGGNAIKFTEQGEVVVSVRGLEQDDEHVLLGFSVSDTGIGIAPEHQRHIFSGFSQAESSTTRRFGGTGLGLAISQRLIGLMGSELVLESAPGVGSTFSFAVRLQRSPDPALKAESRDVAVPASKAISPEFSAVSQVVLIEPHARSRVVLSQLLHGQGLSMQIANGLDELHALTPSDSTLDRPSDEVGSRLLLIDGRTPGLVEALPDLHGAQPPWRVVAMGSMAVLQGLAERSAEGQGPDATLVKPVVGLALNRALAQALQPASEVSVSEAVRASPQTEQPLVLEGLKILVVEDNANNQQVAQELLQAQGAVVDLANHGQEGIDRVRDAVTPYDLVLMDLQMPVMDGLTATRHLRAWLDGRPLPICAMTANASPADRENCLAAGCDDHVGKPFDLEGLLRVITRLTGREQPDQKAEAQQLDPVMPAGVPESAQQWARDLGLDLRRGLRRMGDHVATYRRMLGRFLVTLDEQRQALATALEAGDGKRLAQLGHGLRGQAAQLGMGSLAVRLGELEALADGLVPPQPETLRAEPALAAWRAVDEAMAPWVAASETWAQAWPLGSANSGDTGAGRIDLDPTAWRDRLEQLKALLQASDMQALAEFEALEPDLRALDAARCERLSGALDQLAFDQAGQEVAGLLQSMST
jgi:two-component system, sensor histidine kinase and response regulator